MEMFCYQCEQTAGAKGCVKIGVCGKQPDTANLQDLLIYILKVIAFYGNIGRSIGVVDNNIDHFIAYAMFSTLTNVNFDNQRFVDMIYQADKYKEELKNKVKTEYERKHGKWDKQEPEAALYRPSGGVEELLEQSKGKGIMADEKLDMDIRSLREIIIYGLKGMGAYAHHAQVLGKSDEEVYAFFHKGLAATLNNALSVNDLVGLALECGKVNYRCMEILNEGHKEHYGIPEPTEVELGVKKGPFIVVSGHDLHDLEELLKQTEGKGINIYTHGEMLPAHAYPGLKKYPHLAGNFGTAWQNQQVEFDNLPGAILFTTNCLMPPKDSYKDRLFTTSMVGFSGIQHIDAVNGKKDFTPVINKALELGGYKEDNIEKKILVGFGHDAVIGVADKVIDLIKQGKIKRFMLIGGCDGAKPGRNYYTEMAQRAPEDTIILTLACGKYRINRLDLGDIEGIPRLLDVGQCNDSYSAIRIALALADAFKCGVNDLPLHLVLSWYEQKAVAILLTLLHLGIKNIRLGPTLPAFITPNVLQVLIDNFNIMPISNAEHDLGEILV
ncbi:Hydroxylamine reductase [Caloramator mitchellensis]|uniref:Hydroxylamine reductase n=1 Tax=Caloramator mitchellensis TaxID=908809 RepID=A0A0R3JTN9_CALMK|nr:hydroxylamine reductase [Caloramator mitchellensis]KRQ86889.1 Hydroxylamine reductase [Caloramator mitchellensis]